MILVSSPSLASPLPFARTYYEDGRGAESGGGRREGHVSLWIDPSPLLSLFPLFIIAGATLQHLPPFSHKKKYKDIGRILRRWEMKCKLTGVGKE